MDNSFFNETLLSSIMVKRLTFHFDLFSFYSIKDVVDILTSRSHLKCRLDRTEDQPSFG